MSDKPVTEYRDVLSAVVKALRGQDEEDDGLTKAVDALRHGRISELEAERDVYKARCADFQQLLELVQVRATDIDDIPKCVDRINNVICPMPGKGE